MTSFFDSPDPAWFTSGTLGRFGDMVGRIPILDVTPQLEGGKYAAKAAVGEPFDVTAIVIREGHDALSAEVVLTGPDGKQRRPVLMHREEDDVDRWRATVVADTEGPWTFHVQGWGDPVATWQHNAGIKVPAGIDVELMFTEGALVMKRAAENLEAEDAKVLLDAATALL